MFTATHCCVSHHENILCAAVLRRSTSFYQEAVSASGRSQYRFIEPSTLERQHPDLYILKALPEQALANVPSYFATRAFVSGYFPF